MIEYRIRNKKNGLFFGTNKYGNKNGGKSWFLNAWKAYACSNSVLTAAIAILNQQAIKAEDLEIVEVEVKEKRTFSVDQFVVERIKT